MRFLGQADANWNEAINLSFDFSPPQGQKVFIKCIKATFRAFWIDSQSSCSVILAATIHYICIGLLFDSILTD